MCTDGDAPGLARTALMRPEGDAIALGSRKSPAQVIESKAYLYGTVIASLDGAIQENRGIRGQANGQQWPSRRRNLRNDSRK